MRQSIFGCAEENVFEPRIHFPIVPHLLFQVYLEMVRSTFGEREEKSEMQQINLLLGTF
jgi:hypothetical protein